MEREGLAENLRMDRKVLRVVLDELFKRKRVERLAGNKGISRKLL